MFYIMEIQKMDTGAFAHLVYTAEDEANAWSTYYGKLSYAAISKLPMHTVVLLSADGEEMEHKAFWYEPPKPDPEPEPEPEEETSTEEETSEETPEEETPTEE